MPTDPTHTPGPEPTAPATAAEQPAVLGTLEITVEHLPSGHPERANGAYRAHVTGFEADDEMIGYGDQPRVAVEAVTAGAETALRRRLERNDVAAVDAEAWWG